MTHIDIRLTAEELELLTSLADDQMFRREFIDPKLPGHRNDPRRMLLGKALVARLHALNPATAGRQAQMKSRANPRS